MEAGRLDWAPLAVYRDESEVSNNVLWNGHLLLPSVFNEERVEPPGTGKE
jgi:hypothetical protein